jgi:hypothetical protein
MTQNSQDYAEQLSALMDGELPDAEARFLLRRLEHDAELRAAWERMQLASACLRSQAWRPLDGGFAARVADRIAQAPAEAKRPWLRWAVAASVRARGRVMAPRLLQSPAGRPAAVPAVASAPAPAPDHMVPTPASADLVALREPAAVASRPTEAARGEGATLVAAVEPSHRASPLPLDSSALESPTDFPLVDNGEQRRWPRSEIVSASSDPSIEAYLVRHNQMIAEDGLGGFVPYVDVVSNTQPAAGAEASETAPAPESDEK